MMTAQDARWFAAVESNTTGTGRKFCAAATARGLRPVVLTRDPAKYPYIADDALDTLIVDTSDSAAVLEAVRGLGNRGLAGVTSSSEYFAATAATAARELGLPSPDPKMISRCRDKTAQRAALAGAGVPVPAYREVTDVTAATRAASDIGYPVVVKPPNGSGSVGVRLCHDGGEVAAWTTTLLSGSERVLVEEHADGPEFSVETFDNNVVGVVSKHIGPEPYFVETGHDFPARVEPDQLAELICCATSALAALGLTWGPAHIEIRLTEHGPVLIEVNPRLAGGMIPELVRLAAGIDLVDATVVRVCGLDRPEPVPGAGHAAIRFVLTPATGVIGSISGLGEARRCQGVHDVTMNVRHGDRVSIRNSFHDRLGFAIATAADATTAAQCADDARNCIAIDIH